MRNEVDGLRDRKAVLAILQDVLANGMTMSAACASIKSSDPSRRAWIERMADSVMRHLRRADAVLDGRLSKKPKLRAMNVLRLSVVEMYAESIPAYAAVDQAVRLLKLNSSTRHIAAVANAVLRAAAENGKPAWENAGPPRLPHKIGGAIRREWGEAAVAAIERAHEKIPPLDITPKSPCGAESIAERLGGTILPTGSIRLLRAGRITELPGFAEGEWWVQDAAAAVPVRLLGDIRGESVVDFCAAPGGKAMQCAAGGARMTMLDSSGTRINQLRANFRRTGLDGEVVCADATAWAADRKFDVAVVDAPCSATGTMRRHPDILFRRGLDQRLVGLAEMQRALLDRALGLVRSGGRILYCVCSLLPEEGEEIVRQFLKARDVVVQPLDVEKLGLDPRWLTEEGGLRLRPDYWPELGGMDGFYAAVLKAR